MAARNLTMSEYCKNLGRKEGRKEGRNEGRKEGRKEGLQEGIRLGKIDGGIIWMRECGIQDDEICRKVSSKYKVDISIVLKRMKELDATAVSNS